jgi:hypothetical protein
MIATTPATAVRHVSIAIPPQWPASIWRTSAWWRSRVSSGSRIETSPTCSRTASTSTSTLGPFALSNVVNIFFAHSFLFLSFLEIAGGLLGVNLSRSASALSVMEELSDLLLKELQLFGLEQLLWDTLRIRLSAEAQIP